MKNLFYILFFILLGCEKNESGDSQAEVVDRSWVTWDTCGQKPQDNPCNFILKNQDGDEVELYDYHGKVIIVDLSTMWCGVCKSIAPVGDALVAEYGSENLVWLTILVEDETGLTPDTDDLKRWVDFYSGSPPVLGGDRSLIDPDAVTGYPVSGWPTLAVIDRNMVLTNGVNGWSESYIRGWIEDSL